jgi:hypothetical protein
MKKETQYLSGAEQTIITGLGHPLYTIEFIQEWINRNDLVFIFHVPGLKPPPLGGQL